MKIVVLMLMLLCSGHLLAMSSASAILLGKEIVSESGDEMNATIVRALFDLYAAENNLAPTTSEVDVFVNYMKTSDEMDMGENVSDDMLKQMAPIFLKPWKINKSLFGKYKGRVIFQQFGPEPIDAYRNYLKECERDGKFLILKKEYEAGFWNYYVNDSIHSFYTDEEGAVVINQAPWLPHQDR